MTHIEIDEAESVWFDLLARVEAGEAFVLTRNGAPLASLTPLTIGAEVLEPPPDQELDAWE